MNAEARRSALAAILRSEDVASQDRLASRLREAGFEVTQATVSRDLEALGAIRGKRGGRAAYVIPDEEDGGPAIGLDRVLAEWGRSAEAAGNFVILRTRPGSAQVVGAALDDAALPEVAGTIAGDDTLFVAARDGHDPSALAERLRAPLPNRGANR